MRLEEDKPAGTQNTAGFVEHRGKTGTVCTRTRNGYGLGNLYPQYTRA
jgi:hypothetical protein